MVKRDSPKIGQNSPKVFCPKLYVLSSFACLVHYVLSCPKGFRDLLASCSACLLPYVSRVLLALVPHVPCAMCSLVSHVYCALRAPVFHLPRALRVSLPTWPRAWCLISPFFLGTLLFRILRTLSPNITFCALEFPCITLLFSVHLLLVIFGKFTKVKMDIVLQYYFQVTISIYQWYHIFELFETKYCNIFIANYFGTGEGKFKAWYDNHKKLFPPYR